MRIRKILFATDFSPASRRAFDAALDLAKQNKAELTIFHSLGPAVLYAEAEMADSLYAQIEADTRKTRRPSCRASKRGPTRERSKHEPKYVRDLLLFRFLARQKAGVWM